MGLDFKKYKEFQFCDNPLCPMHNKVGEGNIKIFNSDSKQVYCNICKNHWVITKNTFFYQLKTPINVILKVLYSLSEGMGVRAIRRADGVCNETIQDWILRASMHIELLTNYLQKDMHLSQCQIDEFWSFIKKKKKTLPSKKKYSWKNSPMITPTK